MWCLGPWVVASSTHTRACCITIPVSVYISPLRPCCVCPTICACLSPPPKSFRVCASARATRCLHNLRFRPFHISVHAVIEATGGHRGGGWLITNRSVNGIIVNGHAVRSSRHPLHDGDILAIGNTELEYRFVVRQPQRRDAITRAEGLPILESGSPLDPSVPVNPL